MKCPKCGYHSFDHLDSCKKCSQDLVEHKEKFSLRGFFSPGQPAETKAEAVIGEGDTDTEPANDGSVDFGFDFLDEEQDPVADSTQGIAPGDNDQDVSIDQPFAADSETIPADTPSLDSDEGSDDKPGKGPEFAF